MFSSVYEKNIYIDIFVVRANLLEKETWLKVQVRVDGEKGETKTFREEKKEEEEKKKKKEVCKQKKSPISGFE